MKDEGIFSRNWLPGAMNIPRSVTRVKQITGMPPGYAQGQPSATAGLGEPGVCDEGMYLFVPMNPTLEPYCTSSCPDDWAVENEAGSKLLCVERSESIPVDQQLPSSVNLLECLAQGGVWNESTEECESPDAIPTGTPTPTPIPVPTPSTTTPSTTTPAVVPATSAVPAGKDTPQNGAQASDSKTPNWVYVGAAGAVILVVGALVLR